MPKKFSFSLSVCLNYPQADELVAKAVDTINMTTGATDKTSTSTSRRK